MNYVDIALPKQKSLVSRVSKKSYMEPYKRFFVFAWVINLCYLYYGFTEGLWWNSNGFNLTAISNMVVINFCVAILVRQQYTINLLFWLATRAPTSWPLSIRWALGKVYHHGGIHSGCASVGTFWFMLFVGAISYQHMHALSSLSMHTIFVTYLILLILVTMVALAIPSFRSTFHNIFEISHRFGGWSSLLLFWAQTIFLLNDLQLLPTISVEITAGNIMSYITELPLSILLLTIITFSVMLPWLRLKKVRVHTEKPSSHVCITRFAYGVTPFAGSSTSISRSPLLEWHSFANVPSPQENGFRLTISHAGDWTREFIDDLPPYVWVKGIPTAGVANIEVLFTRVVYVATGSGVGPCLPHLLAQQVPAHLVWSTRTPRETYGDQLVDEILSVQPNATIWDTTTLGKPDMVELAYKTYKEFNAEAVICIANQKLTKKVLYELESRGIPAFGAIWDS